MGHQALKALNSVAGNLEQKLRKRNTAILADTLHFEALTIHDLGGTMLSPSTILQALSRDEIQYHIWAASKKVLESWEPSWENSPQERVVRVLEQLSLEVALACNDRFTGTHIAFVDPRRHCYAESLKKSAYRLQGLFRSSTISPENMVISIPATEAGIMAAKHLQETNININLNLVSSLLHAAVCAETNAAAITIPVGTLLEAHEGRWNAVYEDLNTHPGIHEIWSILAYFQYNRIPTKVVGTKFRNLREIGALSGFDAICVTREQLDRLKWNEVPIVVPPLDGAIEEPAVMRARQAKYPMDLMSREGGFTAWFSPESRKIINDILEIEIGPMQDEMRVITKVVSGVVEDQFKYKKMDLKGLYNEGSATLGKKHRKKGVGRESPKSCEGNPIWGDLPAREEKAREGG